MPFIKWDEADDVKNGTDDVDKVYIGSDQMYPPDNNYALGSPVNVTVSGGKYYFDGQDPDQYTVTSGSYLFQNVPSSHPMAFTMNQAGQNVVFGGQGANAVGQKTSTIDGQTYTYWHGDIILYITGPSNDFYYECYYHGPMGGQDRMKNLAT